METIKIQINRLYHMHQQAIRFVIVGVINTIVGYGSYVIFVYLGIYYLIANILSYVVGTINSYIWNKYFTFKSKKRSFPELLRFIFVYVVQLLVNMGLLKLLVERFGMNKMIAGIPTLLVTTLISFFGHKYFSFRKFSKSGKS